VFQVDHLDHFLPVSTAAKAAAAAAVGSCMGGNDSSGIVCTPVRHA
jgi:hypothetical protein